MRVGRMALAAVAVPLAAKAIRKMNSSMQSRRGNTRVTRAIDKATSGMGSGRFGGMAR